MSGKRFVLLLFAGVAAVALVTLALYLLTRQVEETSAPAGRSVPAVAVSSERSLAWNQGCGSPPARSSSRTAGTLLVEFDDESGVHFKFPGGGVEPGETLEEAVRREVREEACLDVRVDRLLLIVESIASRDTNRIAD